VLVVGCLAANHGAQAQNGNVASGRSQPRGHGRNLERARDPGHVNAILGNTVGRQRLHGAVEHPCRDRLVEASDNNRKTAVASRRRTFINGDHQPFAFMPMRNSALDFVFCSRVTSSSIASGGFISLSTRRKTQIRRYSSGSSNISSFRVPLRLMSIAGQIRRSTSLRSSKISWLPVPLNSSKITSSMRLPVSTRAVPMIVREPPSSTLRAEPKNRFGRCKALASTPPERILPELGHSEFQARARRVIESRKIRTS